MVLIIKGWKYLRTTNRRLPTITGGLLRSSNVHRLQIDSTISSSFSTTSNSLQRKLHRSTSNFERNFKEKEEEEGGRTDPEEPFEDEEADPESNVPTFPWLYGDRPPRLDGPLLLMTFPGSGLTKAFTFLLKKFVSHFTRAIALDSFSDDYFQRDFVVGAEFAFKNLAEALSSRDLPKLQAITTENLYNSLKEKLDYYEGDEFEIEILQNQGTEVREFVFAFGPPDLMTYENKDFLPIFLKNAVIPAPRKGSSARHETTMFHVARQGAYIEVHVALQVKTRFKRQNRAGLETDQLYSRTHWLTFTTPYLEKVGELEKAADNINWTISDLDFLVTTERMNETFNQITLAQRGG